MPKPRKRKTDHLIYADHTGSRGKSGVWFGEQTEFKALQAHVMGGIKEKINWIPLDGALLAIDADPPGITVIAPNPSLPGVIVVSDGSTPTATAALQERYTDLVRKQIEVTSERPAPLPKKTRRRA